MSSRGEIRSHDLPNRELTDRARMLVAEADVTDRDRRFGMRMDSVTGRVARRARNQVWTRWTVAVVVGVAAAAIATAIAGPIGILAVVAGLLVPAVRAVMERAASKRGADAWDWRTQRHVLTGNPAKEVQALDDPRQ